MLSTMRKAMVFLIIIAIIVPSYGMQAQASEAVPEIDQHLAAYWPMDEGSGTHVADLSGNGNDAVLKTASPQWSKGYLGAHSLKLGSSIDRMEVAEPASLHALSGQNQFTIAFWLNYEANGMYQGLLGFDDLHIALVDGGNLQLLSDNYNENLITDPLLQPKQWQHVAIRVDGSRVDFIINGEQKQSLSFKNSEHRVDLTGSFMIGFDHDSEHYLFQYDDFRIYDRPIANEQLRQLAEMFEAETEPPSAPVLTFMGGNHAVINLQWSESLDNDRVQSYELYQDGQLTATLDGAVTNITVRQLAADQRYAFQVRAKDRSGNVSAPSNTIYAKTDETQSKASAAIGMNVSGVFDYSTELPFVDVFNMAREWNNNQPQELELDEHGWVKSLKPGQRAETYLLLDLQGYYPAGEYTLLHDGEGEIEVREGHGVTVTSQKQGEIIINVEEPSNAGIFFAINKTNPDNYIRNIRVIMPGFLDTYEQQPFNPLFLEKLAPFKVIRFMDWMRTNDNAGGKWEERTTAESYTQTRPQGVAVEYMVMLANELQSDAWFNMPTYADNEYIRQFATYVRDHLDPQLKAYIEYSNEIWNAQFEQNKYAVEQGKLLGYSGSDHDIQAKFMGHRSRQIFEIWEDVFGGTDRLVRVMGGFGWDQAYSAELSLQQDKAYEKTDAFAIAPYFGNSYGTEKAEFAKSATLDAIFEDLQEELELSKQASRLVYEQVSQYGIDLIAYEGGQHLAGSYYDGKWYPDDDELTARLLEINRDPRMKDLYLQYFDNWKEAGGKTFANFSFVGTFSKWGSWGALEYLDQPLEETPKYAALLEWIADNPIWWEEKEAEAVVKPAAPSKVQAVAGDGQATVSFSGSDETADYYIVAATTEHSSTPITAIGQSSPITVTGLTNDVTYTFTVTAVNAAGASEASEPVTAMPNGAPSPTTEPTSSPEPSDTPTPTTDPTSSPEPSDTPAPTSEPTASPEPSGTPLPTPSPKPSSPPPSSGTPLPPSEPLPTIEPTASPAPSGTPTPTPEPTMSPSPSSSPAPVLTDISGHWAEQAINQAIAAGFVKGYADGEFKPNQSVTRAEFIVMLLRILKLDNEAEVLTFSDQEQIGTWARDSIAQATAANLISGYSDGSFRPNQPVTRIEMAAIIARGLEDADASATATSFADDRDIASWAKGAVQYVYEKGIMTGRENNLFTPHALATRAEAVTVLVRLLNSQRNAQSN